MLSHRRPVIAADTQPVAASSAGGPSLGRGLKPDYDLEFDLDAPTPPQLALPTARDIEQLRAKVCLVGSPNMYKFLLMHMHMYMYTCMCVKVCVCIVHVHVRVNACIHSA